MFWKDRQGVALGTFERLAAYLRDQGEELTCATNGGIYQEDLRPLGLYIERGRVLHRLNVRRGAYGNFYFEPNGVFLVEQEQARIVDTATFDASSGHLGRCNLRRKVVLAVTETPVSFHDLAVLLRDRLKCSDALHLDSSISGLFPGEGPVARPAGP